MHLDQVEADGAKFSLLILPGVAAMSDTQCAAIRKFVERGGGLIATGDTSRRDECRRCHGTIMGWLIYFTRTPLNGHRAWRTIRQDQENRVETLHSYLRLVPERRAAVDGSKNRRRTACHRPTALRMALRGFGGRRIFFHSAANWRGCGNRTERRKC